MVFREVSFHLFQPRRVYGDSDPSCQTANTASSLDSNPTPVAPTAGPTIISSSIQKITTEPEEINLAQHFYRPGQSRTLSLPVTFETAASRLDMPPAGRRNPYTFGVNSKQMPPSTEKDPMLSLMSKILSPNAAVGGINSRPPFGPQSAQSQQNQMPILPPRPTPLWRFLHTLLAVALGLAVIMLSPFGGTKLERDRAAAAVAGSASEREWLASLTDSYPLVKTGLGGGLFWAFATGEAILLGTRWLFLSKKKKAATAAAKVNNNNGEGDDAELDSVEQAIELALEFFPAIRQPVEYLRPKVAVAMRYVDVGMTLWRDVMLALFVLGAVAWWRA